jgi:hypothetical protein
MSTPKRGPVRGGIVKKLLFVLGGALLMAACSEAPTSPSAPKAAPVGQPSFDLTCKSGYIIAYDENGNPYCAPDPNGQNGQSASRPSGRP